MYSAKGLARSYQNEPLEWGFRLCVWMDRWMNGRTAGGKCGRGYRGISSQVLYFLNGSAGGIIVVYARVMLFPLHFSFVKKKKKKKLDQNHTMPSSHHQSIN